MRRVGFMPKTELFEHLEEVEMPHSKYEAHRDPPREAPGVRRLWNNINVLSSLFSAKLSENY